MATGWQSVPKPPRRQGQGRPALISARAVVQPVAQGIDWARPATAQREPLATVWKLVKSVPGGPHEIARRADIPVHTLAQILLGREPLPPEFCGRVREAIAEGFSAKEVSLAEVRWQNLVRLLLKAFKGWPPKMAQVLGIDEGFVRLLLLGGRRMSEEMARLIEDKMDLPDGWFDQTEAGTQLVGDVLLSTRTANLLLQLAAEEVPPAGVGDRLPASSETLIARLTELLAQHGHAIAGKGTAGIIDVCGIEVLRSAGRKLNHEAARLAERQLDLPEGWLDRKRQLPTT